MSTSPEVVPFDLDPSLGTVTLRTGVTGSAARLGHRLQIELESWSGQVDFADGAPTAVRIAVDLDSLAVTAGKGGATPLSPVDRRVIRSNALRSLGANTYPQATFASTSLELDDRGLHVAGELTIRAVKAHIRADVAVQDEGDELALTADIPVLQSAFGVKPFSVMLGQLRVADEVVVHLWLRVPKADLPQ